MKSAFRPFRKPTVNPEATGRLDSAMDYLRGNGGFSRGETLAGVAKRFQVSGEALRHRCRKAGVTTPGALATMAKDEAMPEAHRSEKPEGVALAELIVGEEEGDGEKLLPTCNFESVYTSPPAPPAPPRASMPVLSEAEIDRHDEQVARLVRDSIEAFRKGKGPGGRRVIPIGRVSDLTALDTLYRRATRQGEREAQGTARPAINIQFLGTASRESVRVARGETSKIADVAGEES